MTREISSTLKYVYLSIHLIFNFFNSVVYLLMGDVLIFGLFLNCFKALLSLGTGQEPMKFNKLNDEPESP